MSKEIDDSDEFSEPEEVEEEVEPEICPGCNKCSHGLRNGLSQLGGLNWIIIIIAGITFLNVCSLQEEVKSQKSELSEIKQRLDNRQRYTTDLQSADTQPTLVVPRYVEERFIH